MKYVFLIIFLFTSAVQASPSTLDPRSDFETIIDQITEEDKRDYIPVYCCFMLNYGEVDAVPYSLTPRQNRLYGEFCVAFNDLGNISYGQKWALLMRFYRKLCQVG